jgi:flagellar basal-body rod protein FlgC
MAKALMIAVSGLNDAVKRMVNVASNLVNASSTGRLPKTPDEKATSYQPTDVVTLSNSAYGDNLGVQSTIRPREPAYTVARDPRSPDANAEGLVAAPNVDIASELIAAKMAEISYKANAAVIRAEREADKELLDRLV